MYPRGISDSYSVLYSSPVSADALLGARDSLLSTRKAEDPRVTVDIDEPVIFGIAILPPILKPIVADISGSFPDVASAKAALFLSVEK